MKNSFFCKVIVIFIGIMMGSYSFLLGQSEPPDRDPYEDDNDPCEQAPVISFGTTMHRYLEYHDGDWFQFYGQAGMLIEIQGGTDCPMCDPRYVFGIDITLFAPGFCDGNYQKISYDGKGTGYLFTRKICVQLPVTGIYYIMITCPTIHLHFWPRPGEDNNFPFPEGEYWVSLNQISLDGYEPDNDADHATPLAIGGCSGGHTIAPMYQMNMWAEGPMPPGYSDQDVFSFNGKAGEVIRAEVKTADPNDDPDLALYLVQYNNGWVVLDYSDDIDGSLQPAITFTLPEDGVYYLLVEPSAKWGIWNQTSTGPYEICLFGQPGAEMDSDRNVGLPPLGVKFWSSASGGGAQYYWWFAAGSNSGAGARGEGAKTSYQYWFTGNHFVRLLVENPVGTDDHFYWENGCSFVEVYGPCGLAPMVIVEHGPDHPSEPWENAIDGDTFWWTGMATVKPNSYAIFAFADGRTKHLHKMRLMVDGKVGFEGRWLRSFRIATSENGSDWQEQIVARGINWGNHEPCSWYEFLFPPDVQAKFIKFIVDAPTSGWVQIGEFEIYEHIQVPDPAQCSIQAASLHRADGIDAATITLTLRDAQGAAVVHYDYHDIQFYCMGEDQSTYRFTPVEEIGNGVYITKLTSTKEGVKKVVAVAHGAIVGYGLHTGATCSVTFVGKNFQYPLKIVQASPAYVKEPWEHAIDGITQGWEGTATVTGNPPFAIFAFPDDGIFWVNKFGIQTDNGLAVDEKITNREARRIRIEGATTGYEDKDFRVLLETNIKNGDMTYFFLNEPVEVKYIRLTILKPDWSYWRQVVEFTVEVALPEKIRPQQIAETSGATIQAYPNPFNAVVQLKYTLTQSAWIDLKIFNIRGQEIATLYSGQQKAGEHITMWDSGTMPSGIYFYRLTIGNQHHNGRLLVLK